ncbi:hypothetical protein ACFU6I_14240 [Streptomyces sp. NPDC057486]|uniref:hypothetical protein n=1 Tax=Streptomyces sp. NPDC057486 TaxID=3346145 RepID=UPI00369788A0
MRDPVKRRRIIEGPRRPTPVAPDAHHDVEIRAGGIGRGPDHPVPDFENGGPTDVTALVAISVVIVERTAEQGDAVVHPRPGEVRMPQREGQFGGQRPERFGEMPQQLGTGRSLRDDRQHALTS